MKKNISKKIAIVLSMCFLLSISTPVLAKNGDIAGYTKYTDIVAYINHFAIQSYNYKDMTYVVAEDLRNFGFAVEWNATSRTINILRDKNNNSINQYSIPTAVPKNLVGKNAMPILETDIKAYINGVLADSGNIGGKTVISFEDLKSFGKVEYVDSIRAIKLWIEDGLQMNKEMQNLRVMEDFRGSDNNPYNRMGFINITDRTIQDIANENGMELSELLEEYGLPADMPANTYESAAYYMMPVKIIAKLYEIDFKELKELLDFGYDVTEDTPWGIAEGEVTLENYIGSENFESFKEEYGFGDEVTLKTKWKDVRNIVDSASRAKYMNQ